MRYNYIVFDIECNGLEPNEIFVISIIDIETGKTRSFVGIDEIAECIDILSKAQILIGHYIKGFDCPVIEHLTDHEISFDRSKLVDTYELSRFLVPQLPNHKLRTWGELLEFPKGEFTDFSKFSPEMVTYCERDTELTFQVFVMLFEILWKEYPETPKQFQIIDILKLNLINSALQNK